MRASSVDGAGRHPSITAAARNAAAVQKIFNEHYTQAKITAGSGAPPFAAPAHGSVGSRSTREERVANTIQEAAASGAASLSSRFSSGKDGEKGGPFAAAPGGGHAGRLFPKTGIEAFTGGTILAGDVQPAWQRPRRRDLGYGLESDDDGRGGGERDPRRTGEVDVELMMGGGGGGRKPLQTATSQQEKELRTLSERIYGIGASTGLREKKIVETLETGGAAARHTTPYGIGRRVEEAFRTGGGRPGEGGRGPISFTPASPLATTPRRTPRKMEMRSTREVPTPGGGRLGRALSRHSTPTVPSRGNAKGLGDRREQEGRKDEFRGGGGRVGDTRGRTTSPAVPLASGLPLGLPSTPAHPPPPPSSSSSTPQPPLSPSHTLAMKNLTSLSRGGGGGGLSVSSSPLHHPGRIGGGGGEVEWSTMQDPSTSSAAASSPSSLYQPPLPPSSSSLQVPKGAEDAAGGGGGGEEREAHVPCSGVVPAPPSPPPVMPDRPSSHEDPHRSYLALVRAKAKHAFSLPCTKPIASGGGGGPSGSATGIWNEQEEMERLYVYASQRKSRERGEGVPREGDHLERASPNGSFLEFPKGKLRQLSKQRRDQMERERAIRAYESSLPLRRVADPYVQHAHQPGQLYDARPVGVPTERTLQVLSENAHGQHPIIGNAYRQQLLRGEPLMRRVLRGDFYQSPQADSYAVVPKSMSPPPPQHRMEDVMDPHPEVPGAPYAWRNEQEARVGGDMAAFYATHPQVVEEAARGRRGIGEGMEWGEYSGPPSPSGSPLHCGRNPPRHGVVPVTGGMGVRRRRDQLTVNKTSHIQKNKERIREWSEFNTRQRYYQEQLQARARLPPRRGSRRRANASAVPRSSQQEQGPPELERTTTPPGVSRTSPPSLTPETFSTRPSSSGVSSEAYRVEGRRG